MNISHIVRRSAGIVIVATTLVLVIAACLTGCSLDSGPDTKVVATQAADNIDAAADGINEALTAWDRIGREADSRDVRNVANKVDVAVENARSVIASAQAEIALCEPSELTTSTLRTIAALETLADSAEAAFSEVDTACAINEAAASLVATIGAGWDLTDDFWNHCNDEQWKDASASLDAAQAKFTAARAAAVAANEKWPDASFNEYVAYLDKALTWVAEGRKQVDYGRNMNHYSRTSVNRYNNQLKVMDAVNDELSDWTMPATWNNPWVAFASIEGGIDTCGTDFNRLQSALSATRALLAPAEGK